MSNVKNNAEMENGMFNAAQLKNETIIVNNGTITFYHYRVFNGGEMGWHSFKADSELAFREVVKIMHHNLKTGIDLVVDGKFIGYFVWSNNFENGYVGWKLFTDNGDKIAEDSYGMKRYCENAVNIMAAYMYDYIKENYIDPVDAADIAEYCRYYGYDFALAYFECHDSDTADDTVLMPMLGEVPDGFYDAFGEDAMWDYDAMYMGMADYLNEGDKRRWRVECDGYRVYGYTIDTDPGEPDENNIMEETDDMYQYASEAAEEIEGLADSVNDAYSDIIAEMKQDEPDIEYAMGRVDDMYRNIEDIENELKWCLHRCDERTGCDIGWDDFCTADYFEPIKIHGDWDCPSYSIAEFINDYNSDAADFMNTLIENIWKALGGQNGDTFRNAIADLDMPFYIAA